jgi:DNA-binding winged helix-turn-helix (wHTH) protein/tetratricopeptide (TPR) repeat protein
VRVALDDGWVELERGTVHRAKVVSLRAKEAALLRYLAERPGLLVGRAELYHAVWGYHPGTRSRTLDTTLRRVRDAIERDSATPEHLHTEPGVGYRFTPAAIDEDEATRHVADGLAALPTTGPVVLWGPPGVGRTHWLLAAGPPEADDTQDEVAPGPGLCSRPVRPRRPGVVAVEVTPLTPSGARSLTARWLRTRGLSVELPADLSGFDGLPGALASAVERAAQTGAFTLPGADDPLQRRYTALVGRDGALGALADLGGPLPAELAVSVFGEDRVRSWLDRGYVRRRGRALTALAHVRRAAAPDPALATTLRDAVHRRFLALHRDVLGPTTRADREEVLVLAPLVTDPDLAVRRALALRVTLPEPSPAELEVWARWNPQPTAVLARLDELRSPAVRAVVVCICARRTGQIERSLAVEPAPDDRSLLAGELAFQLAIGETHRERHDAAVDWYQAALDRWRGHDLLEGNVAGGMAHALVHAGRLEEAEVAVAPLLAGPPEERADGLHAAMFVSLSRGHADAARARARALRDLTLELPVSIASQVLRDCGLVLRELGEHDGAVAALVGALDPGRGFRPGDALAAQIHHLLATTWLDRGDLDAASRAFTAALAVASATRPETDAVIRCLAGVTRELAGHPDEAAAFVAAGLERLPGPSRTARLLYALVRPDLATLAETLAFADRTFDVALRGVALAVRGALTGDGGVPDGTTSFEIRLANRLVAHRAAR